MEDPLLQDVYKIFFGDDRQPSEDIAQLTEAQWKEAGDPRVLLDFLRDKISNRKLNLFAVACCRRAWTLLARPCQAAIEATERFVDGHLSEEQQGASVQAAIDVQVGFMIHEMDLTEEGATRPSTNEDTTQLNRPSAAASAVTYGMSSSPLIGTHTPDAPDQDRGMMAMVSHITGAITGRASDPAEFALQCNLLRDIVGNPFCPVALAPSWQTGTVTALVEGIYADRAFDRLPVLDDALEEAGCSSQGLRVSLGGMKVHPVDSRGRDFRQAAILAVTEAIRNAGLVEGPL
jgi:hypothetical protein